MQYHRLIASVSIALLLPALSTARAAAVPDPAVPEAAVVTPVEAATESSANAVGSNVPAAEITVTATRRATSLQRTPVTVTAISSEDLSKYNITRVDQIAAMVPNFYLQPGVANSSTISLGMRGHSDNTGGFGTTEQPVSFYFDDVFEARPSAVNQEFADIERVEVLRGPQGTLFGRNSMVGAVNVISRTPGDTPYGYALASYGNYQTVRAKGVYGTPLSDTLAVSASGVYVHQGKGYMYDVTTHDDVDKRNFWGLRGKVHYHDNQHWDVVLSGAHTDSKNDGFVTTSYDEAAGHPIPTDSYRVTATPLDSDGKTTTTSADAHVTGKFDGFTVRSITGWSKVADEWLVDLTGGVPTPEGGFAEGYVRHSVMAQHQWTQENQIFGDAFSDKLNWIVGTHLFHERTAQTLTDHFYLSSIDFTVPVPPISYVLSTYSYAGYAQLGYKITSKLELQLGGRYTLEDQHINGLVNPTTPFGAHQTYHAFTPKFGLNYQVDQSAFLYATVSKGFKAGGYSAGSSTVAVAEAGYRPETVWAYEVGAKTQWLDNRVRFNLALFRNNFKDIVTGRFLPDSGIVVLYNGQSYRAQGVEVELNLTPVSGLNIYANGGWLHISNTQFVAGSSDTKPVSEPTYSGSTGFRYEFPVAGQTRLRLGGDYVFRDSYYGNSDRTPVEYNSKISEINAELTLLFADGLQVSAVGRNLANRVEWKNSLDLVSFLGVGSRQPQLPRTYGIEASYRW